MFFDDEDLPMLPDWEEQIQQLEEIKEQDGEAEAPAEAEGG